MIPPVAEGESKTGGYNFGRDILGKDDFFRILVTQLRYQDPLEPTQDREFIAQMAQFSSLEQSQNLNNEFGKIQAINLLGKNIKYVNEDQEVLEGKVDGVRIESGRALVTIGSTLVDPASIISISQ